MMFIERLSACENLVQVNIIIIAPSGMCLYTLPSVQLTLKTMFIETFQQYRLSACETACTSKHDVTHMQVTIGYSLYIYYTAEYRHCAQVIDEEPCHIYYSICMCMVAMVT